MKHLILRACRYSIQSDIQIHPAVRTSEQVYLPAVAFSWYPAKSRPCELGSFFLPVLGDLMIHQPSLARSWSHVERRASLEVFLLGQVRFADCLELQKQISHASQSRAGGNISLILCEHPPVVTQGLASRSSDIQVQGVQYAGRGLDVLPVSRGGGTMLHLPGQLAIYPIVPLQWYHWTVGEFLNRFTQGLQTGLAGCGIETRQKSQQQGLWGRSGQLVSFGVSVKNWITTLGAQVHVIPPPPLAEFLVTDLVSHTSIGSLQQEQRRCVPMSQLRARLARSVSEGFGCEDYHFYTGHPLLERIQRGSRVIARAS